jgi:glutaredoxin 3
MKAIVWSKDGCVHCEHAKQLLSTKGIDTEVRVLGKGQWTVAALLEKVPHAQTVPQIFIDDKYVGGLIELRSKLGV